MDLHAQGRARFPNMRKRSYTSNEYVGRDHRFEHWYRDNTVYFITARCRDKFPAFRTDDAARVFWDRFYHYTELHGVIPWVTTLMNSHYHTLGYMVTEVTTTRKKRGQVPCGICPRSWLSVSKVDHFFFDFAPCPSISDACAAARRAIGTRNGEQLT